MILLLIEFIASIMEYELKLWSLYKAYQGFFLLYPVLLWVRTFKAGKDDGLLVN